MNVQPSRPVDASPRETYKIPVQKIDYISAAWGYLCVQGEWISATVMRQSVIPKLYQQRYSYQIQSRGLRLFFLTNIWRVVSWPDSSQKCQTFNKRTAVLWRKVFFIKVCHFSYWNWIFFFLISKEVRFLSLEAKSGAGQRAMPTMTCSDRIYRIDRLEQSLSVGMERTQVTKQECLLFWTWRDRC